ncbi:hypothetical protein HK100_005167 [Physocladia obscura]|uniref:3-beta hydroxysteroid dehydrogenase/isomerase domain-containing protein n=1 Tax=Physocladia obscura TaxID=109957 RepID=A0AAD5X899_9FUNG|nr:hypothetical protein HK100_005167 [Physocladia obscura]
MEGSNSIVCPLGSGIKTLSCLSQLCPEYDTFCDYGIVPSILAAAFGTKPLTLVVYYQDSGRVTFPVGRWGFRWIYLPLFKGVAVLRGPTRSPFRLLIILVANISMDQNLRTTAQDCLRTNGILSEDIKNVEMVILRGVGDLIPANIISWAQHNDSVRQKVPFFSSGFLLAVSLAFTGMIVGATIQMGKKVERWIVIGGCGFVGRTIVEMLLQRGEKHVAVFDLRQSFEDARIEFFTGNLLSAEDLERALAGRTVVIHTASPPHGLKPQVYVDVNVAGTRNVLAACLAQGVAKLVFTSSAGVVFNGQPLRDADETLPYCHPHMDKYNETKMEAEMLVLAANSPRLKTVAIRPTGIFGPRDSQGLPEMIAVAKTGSRLFQLGDNVNLMDYTYVGNVADAHILAAEKLDESENVAGEAFFITNDAPVFFWDFIQMVYDEYGAKDGLKYVLPTSLSFFLAWIVECFVILLSPIKAIHPKFTLYRMRFMTSDKYHNIEKAKKILGYKPKVALGEGIRLSVKWFKDEEIRKKLSAAQAETKKTL